MVPAVDSLIKVCSRSGTRSEREDLVGGGGMGGGVAEGFSGWVARP